MICGGDEAGALRFPEEGAAARSVPQPARHRRPDRRRRADHPRAAPIWRVRRRRRRRHRRRARRLLDRPARLHPGQGADPGLPRPPGHEDAAALRARRDRGEPGPQPDPDLAARSCRPAARHRASPPGSTSSCSIGRSATRGHFALDRELASHIVRLALAAAADGRGLVRRRAAGRAAARRRLRASRRRPRSAGRRRDHRLCRRGLRHPRLYARRS